TVDRDPHLADQGVRVVGIQYQLVRRTARNIDRTVAAYLRGRLERLEHPVGRFLWCSGRTRRCRARLRRLLCRQGAMGRSVVLAVPGPDVVAVPDDVVLAVGTKHRQACLVRGRIPHPQRMGSRNQGREFWVVLSVRAGNGWNTEIGAFHDGAGEAVGFCLLEVDEELLRCPGRQLLIGTRGGGDQAGARHDEYEGQRRNQAQRWFGVEDPHVPIVASTHCENSELVRSPHECLSPTSDPYLAC